MNTLKKKIGKYEIVRKLGRGTTGVVYEALDPLIERTVALKTIQKSPIDPHEAEEVFKRFQREARAAGRLSHPKIVSIYEYGEDGDVAFIAMELIRGRELKEYFDKHHRFTVAEGVHIVMQLLDALEYSHSCGVVHRDIKPSNIMIMEGGQIKIADFGIAKIDASNLTHAGTVLGTPTYMSPEQFKGLEVDHRTDLYASGVILYQFLTGKRPFTGSVITIMHQAMNDEAAPPSSLNSGISPRLDAVVKKAMAKRPEDRFQSATEFMKMLKAALQPEQPISVRSQVRQQVAAPAAPGNAEEQARTEAIKAALLARKMADAQKLQAAKVQQRQHKSAEQLRREKELTDFMAEHARKYEATLARKPPAKNAGGK